MTACVCVANHSPTPQAINRHHILPLSWGGPNTVTNLVDVCPTTHENIHRLLNAYVKVQGVPAWEIRRLYSPYVRDLAARAWAQRPSQKPPYTLVH